MHNKDRVYCKDCKWFVSKGAGCNHPELVTEDLVFGTHRQANAALARSSQGRCGVRGFFWEEKETEG